MRWWAETLVERRGTTTLRRARRAAAVAALAQAADEDEDERKDLPRLRVEVEDDSRTSRRRALARLDGLLEGLERANLAGLHRPPPALAAELMLAGLPNPHAYSIVELIDIVFASQRPWLRTAPY